MLIRRALYFAQFPAAVILPAWILVGWGLFAATGWEIIGLIVGAMMLTVGMLAAAALVFARKSVRAGRAVSWLDAGLQALLYGLIVAVGLFTPATGLLGSLTVVAVLALFWAAVVQLVVETRRRVRETLADFEAQAARLQTPATGGRTPRIDGEYIVIETSDGRSAPKR